ncbi:MAG: helix-turn-helix domain-containing protein [Defluviitaleaceae bacterium]|nr:helix-turn-helix domain-containing protein [Defluviitaleaceae bacterium]
MTIGEKIKEIRRHMGLSQENLAHDLGCGVATISRIERGLAECGGDILAAIKTALDIQGAPLYDYETATFHERLYIWGQLMMERRMADAEDLGQELSIILKLPYERDLIMLYRLHETALLLTNGHYDDVQEKLHLFEDGLDDMNNEHLYHLYRLKGTLSFRRDNHEDALQFNLKALELKEHFRGNLAGLYYSIATAYSCLNRPFSAIMYLEEARRHHKDDKLSVLGVFIDHVFSDSYLKIGELNRAKALLDKALLRAEAIGHKLGRKKYIGMILHLLGVYHKKRGEAGQALQYYERAFEFFDKSLPDYLENLYKKIECLIAMKRQAEAEELIVYGLEVAKSNEKFTVLYTSLRRLLTLREKEAQLYLENHAVPYLISKSEYFYALDICKQLEEQHKKAGNIKKSLETACISRDVYVKIFLGIGLETKV